MCSWGKEVHLQWSHTYAIVDLISLLRFSDWWLAISIMSQTLPACKVWCFPQTFARSCLRQKKRQALYAVIWSSPLWGILNSAAETPTRGKSITTGQVSQAGWNAATNTNAEVDIPPKESSVARIITVLKIWLMVTLAQFWKQRWINY